MRLTLARSMAHTLSCNTPVKKSTGRFGALQVGKVLSNGDANREKKTGKDFGKLKERIRNFTPVGISTLISARRPSRRRYRHK